MERNCSLQRIQCRPYLRFITTGTDLLDPGDLAGAHPGIVDFEDVMLLFLDQPITIDADDHRLPGVDFRGAVRGGILEEVLGEAL